MVGRSFPPSIWLTKMVQGSIINGGFFFFLNIVLIFVLKLVSHLLYNKALLAFNQEGGGLIENGKIYYKVRNKRFQIIKRHIMIIFTNPTFLLNTVLTMLLPILMFIIMSLTGELKSGIFESPTLAHYIVYIYTAVITTPAMIGSLSATVITREGKTFWETKVLPISTEDNIRYRIDTTLILSLVGSIILAITGGIYLPVTYTMVIVATVFCVCITLLLSTIDIIINIERPTLNWNSPTAAVKNNLNLMLALLIRVVIVGVMYLLYINMPNFAATTIILIYSLIFVILYVIANYLVFRIYIERFNNIVV